MPIKICLYIQISGTIQYAHIKYLCIYSFLVYIKKNLVGTIEHKNDNQ